MLIHSKYTSLSQWILPKRKLGLQESNAEVEIGDTTGAVVVSVEELSKGNEFDEERRSSDAVSSGGSE